MRINQYSYAQKLPESDLLSSKLNANYVNIQVSLASAMTKTPEF